jgi:hypothetical protein
MQNGNCPRCKRRPKGGNGYCKECANAICRERRERRKRLFAKGQLQIPTNKTCYRCKKRKKAALFSPNAATKDGLANRCKACNSEESTKNNKRRKYGLDEEAIIKMIRTQRNVCAICRVPIVYGERKNNFHIDHDHLTGRVRGILCPTCNVGLGKLFDDPVRVESAISYLVRTEPLRYLSAGHSL